MTSLDSFRCCKPLKVGSKTYAYFSLPAAEKNGLKGISRLPFSMKVLLENLLRFEDGTTVTGDDLQAMADWLKERRINREIQYRPARVLMQDFTGVPALVDLAVAKLGPVGAEMKKLVQDKANIEKVLGDGAGRAQALAAETMKAVKDIVGFVRR